MGHAEPVFAICRGYSTVDDINPALPIIRNMPRVLKGITLRTLDYGKYGKFLILGNAGFKSSTVGIRGFPEAAVIFGLESKS